MRKLGRITSYFIAAVMVLCLLPSKTAWAARGRVELGESKYSTADTYEMKIGETKDLNFYGAKGYVYKTDSGSVFWKTTNSDIVSVDRKGLIKAVAPGTATISMTVTVAATRTSYEGSVKVTVKAEDDIKFAIRAFDRTSLIYPNEEAAYKACQKGITVKRVRRFNYGATYYSTVIPTISIDLENRNIINIDMSYNNGDSYIFYAEGLPGDGLEKVVSWDTSPVSTNLSYENAFLSEKGGRDITGTKSLAYCDATPLFELYDKNNIVIGRASNGNSFVGASGVSGSVKYVKKYGTGSATLRSISSGVVRLSSLSQNITVYAVWTSGDKKIELMTNDCLVEPKEYVKPDLGAFVEGILVTNDKGDAINWSGSESWQGTMPASTTKNVLFYFMASDGKKYSGNSDAYAASDIYSLSNEYRFIYQLDESSKNIASITKSGRLTTYREGDVIVEIWLCEPGKNVLTPQADLVGQLNLRITDEPELFDIEFEDQITDVERNANRSDITVKFSLLDQYGEPIAKRVSLAVRANSSSGSQSFANGSVVWNSDNKGGTIHLNLSGKEAGSYSYLVTYSDVIESEIVVILQ